MQISGTGFQPHEEVFDSEAPSRPSTKSGKNGKPEESGVALQRSHSGTATQRPARPEPVLGPDGKARALYRPATRPREEEPTAKAARGGGWMPEGMHLGQESWPPAAEAPRGRTQAPSFPAAPGFGFPQQLPDKAKDLEFMRRQNMERSRPGSAPVAPGGAVRGANLNLAGALLQGPTLEVASGGDTQFFGQRAAGGSHTSHGPVRPSSSSSSFPRVAPSASAIPSKKEIRRREQQGDIPTPDQSLRRFGGSGR